MQLREPLLQLAASRQQLLQLPINGSFSCRRLVQQPIDVGSGAQRPHLLHPTQAAGGGGGGGGSRRAQDRCWRHGRTKRGARCSA